MADEGTPTEAVKATEEAQPEQPKQTETVEYWKQRAREVDKKNREFNAVKAELDELKSSALSKEERAIRERDDAIAERDQARAEVLRWKIAAKHGLTDEDAELFLSGSDEETLTKQAQRLSQRNTPEPAPSGLYVPAEGQQPSAPALNSDELETSLRKKLGIPG